MPLISDGDIPEPSEQLPTVAPGSEVWLTALTRAMARVTTNADRQGVLHALARSVVEEFGAVLARIWLHDPVEAALLPSAGVGLVAGDGVFRHRLALNDMHAIPVRAFASREIVAVNALSEAEWAEDFAWAGTNGLQAFAGFPLLVGERAIGVMGVALRGPWPPLMVQALGALAQQTALALDHVRVIDETHALQVVAADLAQALDLDALLAGIVRQTAVALKADGCAVWLIDHETQKMQASAAFGLSDAFQQARNQLWAHERRPWSRVRESRTALFTRDERQREAAEDGELSAALVHEGIVSCGRLPLWEPGGGMIGLLVLYHRSERVYTESEARLAQAFTDQVALTVLRARLAAREQAARTAVARQVERLTTLTHITGQLLAASGLDAVLRIVVESAGRLCDASGATVGLLDGARRMTVAAAHGTETRWAAQWRPPTELSETFLATTPSGAAISSGEAVAVDDYALWPAREGTVEIARRETNLAYGLRAVLVAPLRVEGTAIGVLRISDTKPRHFTPEDVAIVSALADQAALAIEHTRLLRRSQDAAILEERARLARELHDSVSQALFGITLGASSLKTVLASKPSEAPKLVDYVLSLAHTGQAEMRALIYELRPEALGTEGLVVALEKQAEALHLRHEVQVETEFCAEPLLPLEAKHDLYRIAQEALHNTVKHAQARRIELRLVQAEESLVLSVGDDGVGFDPTGTYEGHYGQQSMRERAAHLGGSVLVISSRGNGTTIRVTIPLPVSAAST